MHQVSALYSVFFLGSLVSAGFYVRAFFVIKKEVEKQGLTPAQGYKVILAVLRNRKHPLWGWAALFVVSLLVFYGFVAGELVIGYSTASSHLPLK